MCVVTNQREKIMLSKPARSVENIWVSELRKLWLWDSLLWIKLHQVNCHRFLWIRGPRIPHKVAPPTGPDKLQGIEIQWNYFSLKAWKRQYQLSTRSSIHFSSPAEKRRKQYKAGDVTELKGKWMYWRSCRVRLITSEEQSKGGSLPRKKTSKK